MTNYTSCSSNQVLINCYVSSIKGPAGLIKVLMMRVCNVPEASSTRQLVIPSWVSMVNINYVHVQPSTS